jgi:GTP-binding protein
MNIDNATFVGSATDPEKCPKPDKPEYAFIGRSNVGKSSLINMLTNHKSLAKTSQTPGKTQLINHFLINNEWYLVDLPGYGWARSGRESRASWSTMTRAYFMSRPNLMCIFVLIDSRLEPQRIDLEFMEWLAEAGMPFVMVFTKADKQSPTRTKTHIERYHAKMLETWEELPQYFITSSEHKEGRDELLGFLNKLNRQF